MKKLKSIRNFNCFKDRNLKFFKLFAKFIFFSTFFVFPTECFGLEDLVYDLLAKKEETLAEKVLKPVEIDLARAYKLYHKLVVSTRKKKKKKRIYQKKFPNFDWNLFFTLREKLKQKPFQLKKLTEGIVYKIPSYSFLKKNGNFFILRDTLKDIVFRIFLSLIYRKIIEKLFLDDKNSKPMIDEKQKQFFIKFFDFVFIFFFIVKIFVLKKTFLLRENNILG